MQVRDDEVAVMDLRVERHHRDHDAGQATEDEDRKRARHEQHRRRDAVEVIGAGDRGRARGVEREAEEGEAAQPGDRGLGVGLRGHPPTHRLAAREQRQVGRERRGKLAGRARQRELMPHASARVEQDGGGERRLVDREIEYSLRGGVFQNLEIFGLEAGDVILERVGDRYVDHDQISFHRDHVFTRLGFFLRVLRLLRVLPARARARRRDNGAVAKSKLNRHSVF